MSEMITVKNDDGEAYQIRQNCNGFIELIDSNGYTYIEPQKLAELIDENNCGKQ